MKLPGSSGLRARSINNFSAGIAALGVFAFAAQADAADLWSPGPPPIAAPAPIALWSGMYGGAHIGGAWADLNTSDLNNYWASGYTTLNNPLTYGVLHTDQSPSAVFGGGTIGYNMQRGGVVFGIEADFGAMGFSNNKILVSPAVEGIAETPHVHISTGFYGDVTGRLGWAWGPWMLYGKGGLAVLETTTNVNDPLFAFSPTADNTRVGWTAGGGVEYLWNPAWSVKVEYQYFDFGTASSSLNYGGETFSFNHNLDINTVKFGINYHLGCCDNALPPPLK